MPAGFLLNYQWQPLNRRRKSRLLGLFYFGLSCFSYLLQDVVIEIFDLLYNCDEKATCVLIMREHPEALRKLPEYLIIIMIDKHGLFEASALVIVSGDIFELTKLQEEISPSARFLKLFSHHSPISEALSEFEAWEIHIDKLNVPLKFLEGRGNHSLIFNRVQRACGIRDLPANFELLKSLEKYSLLQNM